MLAAVRTHTIPGWTDLETEFDAWSAQGKCATFWWRDDDAVQPSAALDQLLTAAGTQPLSIAVVPAQATKELAERLRDVANVSVLQHGLSHTNHAPDGEKKAEFGDHRPVVMMRSELSEGRKRLEDLFGDQFVPIFVPPWNRISKILAAEIADLGFVGLSTFGARTENAATAQLNCHVDIIDWRGRRDFVGTEAAVGQIVQHLAMRRNGATVGVEPTGLMTHHLDHDAGCWQFVQDFRKAVDNHPAAAWVSSTQEVAGRQQ